MFLQLCVKASVANAAMHTLTLLSTARLTDQCNQHGQLALAEHVWRRCRTLQLVLNFFVAVRHTSPASLLRPDRSRMPSKAKYSGFCSHTCRALYTQHQTAKRGDRCRQGTYTCWSVWHHRTGHASTDPQTLNLQHCLCNQMHWQSALRAACSLSL
jgi:hypothetical protein